MKVLTRRFWLLPAAFSVLVAVVPGQGQSQGTVSAVGGSAPPGSVFNIGVVLTLNGGVSVDSLAFGLRIIPNGAAPGPTGSLSFITGAAMPAPTFTDTGGTADTISVSWLKMATARTGTVALGSVVVIIPGSATDGQSYTLRIAGASASLGATNLTLTPGVDATLTISGLSYLVGDVYPDGSDLNGDGDKDDAGEFGDDQLNMLDLIHGLRAVANLPGFRPPSCSDRFDAIDSHPADTPTARGGNGTLNTLDLLYTLRRVTNVDTSRPRRYAGWCPATAAAPQSQGAVTTSSISGLPGSTVDIPITLALGTGVSVDSVLFGVQIIPDGSAPALSGSLSFTKDTSLPSPSLTDTNAGADKLAAEWLGSLSPALSGTNQLGVIRMTIPALATWGQTYSIRVTGASASLGESGVVITAGSDRTLTVRPTAVSYLVGDAFPSVSAAGDLSSDGDTEDAGEFGDGALSHMDLVYALRAVTNVPGYRPQSCSDRFDAIDSHPADPPTMRGGNGILNTVDLTYSLRRLVNLDNSRPWRGPRGLVCSSGAGGSPTPSPVIRNQGAVFASDGSGLAGSTVDIPVTLNLNTGVSVDSLSFGVRIIANGSAPPLSAALEFTGEAPFSTPTVTDDTGTAGAIAVSWLSALTPVTGTTRLGMVRMTIPATALAGHTYTVQVAGAAGAASSADIGLVAGADNTIALPGGTGPASITVTGGNNQNGTVGAALAQPFVVTVRDASNVTVPNVTVSFAVTAGGGSLSVTSANTNSSGQASTILTLGTAAGSSNNTVTASVSGLASVVFTASATAGAPASITIVSGNNQGANAGSTLPLPLVVKVADQYGNPVSGITVNFSIAAGGGNLSATSVNTGSNGQAQVTWTLGSTAGSQTVQASISGLPAVTFAATSVLPGPAITSISPDKATAGTATPVEITVTGSGFISASVVRWNGGDRATTYVSGTELRATIPAGDLAAAGTAQVKVYNPPPGDALSNAATFTIQNPAPTLTGLSVTTGNRLDTGTAITLTGTNFASGVTSLSLPAGMTVNAAGPFTVVNWTTATVTIDIAATAADGANNVTVTNAAPGGGTSGALTFTVSNPVPTVAGLSVTTADRLDTGIAITLTGTKFISGVTSLNLPAGFTANAFTVVNSTTATVTLDIGATAATGANSITVTNTAPGGGTSAAQTFTVRNPAPTLTGLSVTAGDRLDTGIPITLTGKKFISGVTSLNLPAGITVNAAGLFTVVNATTATVTVDIGATAATGANDITVTNAGPGGGTSGARTFTVSNPLPAISGLSPSTVVVGGAAFTLTVNGSYFVNGAVVRWNGAESTTTFVSDSQLRADIPASDIATIAPVSVTVFNPSPGGGTSSAANLAIVNPVPTLESLSPSPVIAGGPGFVLTVNGSGFVQGVVVRWNGSERTTTFRSSTRLEVSIPAGDISTVGSAQVAAFNPSPGGGLSNAIELTIGNPVPAILSLSPSTAVSGGAGFTLNVNGANFIPGSVVRWNGADRTTAFVTTALLQASIPANDIAVAEEAQVTVFNPAPGGGASLPAAFTVANPLPVISGLSPSSAVVGGAGFTLTVNGSKFVNGAAVQWNGAARTTTFVNSTQLTAAIPASDIAMAGTAQVTVFNPAPGGGTSSAVSLPIAAVPASVVKVSGDGQSGQVGTTLVTPLVVQVKDQAGTALGGVSVTFAVTSGAASLTSITVVSASSGQAQTGVTLSTAAGTVTITASVAGVATPALFTLTAAPGPPASFSYVSGNNQATVAGSTLPLPLVVRLADQYSNPISGASVNFSVTGGGGTLSAASATTNTSGQAQVSWTLGAVEGPNTTQASVASLSPVVFAATGLSGAVTAGWVTPVSATGPAGGEARIPITLTMDSGVGVDGLAFGLKVEPNGTAPALSGQLSFVKEAAMAEPTLTDAGLNTFSVGWMGLVQPLEGTARLGEVVVPLPSLATDGHTYTVRITGASGSRGTVTVTLLAGANATISVVGRTYLVGDAFPIGSDRNGDGDKDDVGEFGDGSLQILDLIYALRAVTSVPGYRPPACSDRFDAIDSQPADTPTVRGGNATLNTVDLIYTLRRVTSVDTSRPRRYSRGLPCTAGAGEQLVAQAFQPVQPSEAAARLQFGSPQAAEGGGARVPVYLEAARDLELAGLSFSIGMTGLQPVTWNLEPGTAPPPTLIDPDVPGVLSIAWLEGLQVAAGQRLLLGYVVAPGLAPGTGTLQFIGVSASAPDGSDVRVAQASLPVRE